MTTAEQIEHHLATISNIDDSLREFIYPKWEEAEELAYRAELVRKVEALIELDD